MQAHGFVHRLVIAAGLTALLAVPAAAQRCASGSVDDGGAHVVRTATSPAVTSAPRPGLSATGAPVKPAPVAPLRDEHKKPAPALKAARTSPRLRNAAPHTPASPGMGTLLKWTTGAGLDMSFLFDNDAGAIRAEHIIAGRAPPRAGPHSDPLAPALTPVAFILWTLAALGPFLRGPSPFPSPDASTHRNPGLLSHALGWAEPCASSPGGSCT